MKKLSDLLPTAPPSPTSSGQEIKPSQSSTALAKREPSPITWTHPANSALAVKQLQRLCALTGVELEPGRMAAIAQFVAGRATGRELATTIDYLCESPEFADKLRYRRPLSASDLLTTGFKALPYAAAIERWNRAGCPGGKFPGTMFKLVKSNGQALFVELPHNVTPHQLKRITDDESSSD